MAQQEFINGLGALLPRHHGCVATIGSFDGVHLGHQALISEVRNVASRLNLPSVVIIFEPQPYEYFSREQAPSRLTRLREKVAQLFDGGIDRVLCLKFDQNLRGLSAQRFVDDVLVQGLGTKHLVVGDDFRFGCDRKGDFNFLRGCGKSAGFDVVDTRTQVASGERISSTRIRALLAEDQLDAAARLLGREYSVSGRVIYGNQLGRTLGFPTANIGLGRYRAAVRGVYAVTVVRNVASKKIEVLQGVANVGVKPTISGGRNPLLEVHILNANPSLYGECLEVVFKQKLRAEQRFENLEQLKSQIARDIESAKSWFNQNLLN